MMEDWLKNATEEADTEKELKEVAEATARDRDKATARDRDRATEAAEEKARKAERARILAKQRVAYLETKLREMELKLAEVESIISAKDKEVVELKSALKESEDKFYDMGFTNAEKSREPVVMQT